MSCSCGNSSLPIGPQGPIGPAGNGYLTVTYSLSAANIIALNSTPLTAISAPGAGYAIEVISATAKMIWGSVAFNNGIIQLKTDTATAAQMISGSTFLNATTDSDSRFVNVSNTSGLQVVENKALTITSAADSGTSGDSTVKVYIAYRIITI